MWGKITQIAEKLDETYGSRDVDDNDDNDDDDDDDDMEGEEDGGSGWDDSNDFDDDELDFENDDDDDNDDEEGNDESAPIDATDSATGDKSPTNEKNGENKYSEEDVSSLNATMNDHDDDGAIGKVDDNKDGIAEESMDDFGNGFGDDFDDLDFGDDDDDDIAAEIIDQSQTPSKSSKDEEEEELNNDNIVNTSSSDNNNALDNAFGDDEDFGDLDDSIHNEVEVEEEKEEAVVIKDDDTAINAANNNSNNASPTTTTTVTATLAASELAAMTAVDPEVLAEPPVAEKMKTTTALLHEELSGENVPAAALPSNSSNENDTIANNSDNGNNAVDKNNHDDANSDNDVNNSPRVVTVSAPGKALVAGGYLVLEQPNPGVVLAAKGCRFHSTVMFRPCYNIEGASFSAGSAGAVYAGFVGNAHGMEEKAPWKNIPLDVYSPQFHQVFTYTLSYSSLDSSPRVNYQASTPTSSSTPSTSSEDGSNHLTTLRLQPRKHTNEGDDQKSSNGNKFVEKSLLLALGYLHKCLGGVEFHSRVQQHQHQHQQQQQQQPQQPQPNGRNEAMALAIKLRADNDFYSQITHLKERGMDLTPQNMELLEPFLPCPKSNNSEEGDGGSSGSKVVVNKTGLGSSAALVTSLVGALLNFFGVISLPSTSASIEEHDSKPVLTNGSDEKEKDGLRIAHNLSQICHCYAQGKVGSGFDVSSAVFGSHIYTRFSKGLIGKFLDVVHKGGGSSFSMTESTSQQLLDIVNDVDNQWDCTVSPINLPSGLELLMADVCGGSESPSMAKRILDWKKNKRKVGFLDDYYWKDLKRCNKKIVSLLTDTFVSQSVRDGLRRDGAMILANRTAEQWKKPMPSSWHEFEGSSWDVAAKLLDLRMAILESRQNLKGMGKAAGVPVEPDEQTALANATMALPGVVAAGVPGAGGYDALFVIYVKGPETCDGKSDRVRDEIGNLWREMSNASSENNVDDGEVTVVCPLSVRAAGFGGDSGLCATNLDW